jgi:hypothetical protein
MANIMRFSVEITLEELLAAVLLSASAIRFFPTTPSAMLLNRQASPPLWPIRAVDHGTSRNGEKRAEMG